MEPKSKSIPSFAAMKLKDAITTLKKVESDAKSAVEYAGVDALPPLKYTTDQASVEVKAGTEVVNLIRPLLEAVAKHSG